MRKRLTPEERKERRRRAMQRSKFALPSALTLASIFCGFSSVVMSLNAVGNRPERSFLWAAAFLVAAGVLDALDGRVARATNTTSEFGVELDSLADVVSFGMSPAILAYRYGFFRLGQDCRELIYLGWAASFFFVACGALRLARFNVQVGTSDARFFVGMPIPAGAACVASVILFWPSGPASVHLAYLFAAELFILGILMVCTLHFPSFKKASQNPKTRWWNTMGILVLFSLLIIFRERFFLGFFILYLASALAMNIAWKFGWTGVMPPKPSHRNEPPEESPI